MTEAAESGPPWGPTDDTRRDFIHILAGAMAVGAAAAVAWPLIDQMNPAADKLAVAKIDVDYAKVALGQQITVLWRGSPVFIRHRTPAEIAAAVRDDHADLKDPATDESRHKPGMAEWLIVIGVCTHLGCTPLFGQGEYHGWFCPCHGSVYDTSGRIRKGPAPKNLYLPDYVFQPGGKVKIG
ncbi:MAG TPA: ubiquinol-cytochrome c reductase iron-sulfur subunit [Caulobacteraceae bacterium]|nr:ubiquinol-cytochrome c reductase iron-sulfur subunit [Caulobacteraceae bacterium]